LKRTNALSNGGAHDLLVYLSYPKNDSIDLSFEVHVGQAIKFIQIGVLICLICLQNFTQF
jgi:hypothetical protein